MQEKNVPGKINALQMNPTSGYYLCNYLQRIFSSYQYQLNCLGSNLNFINSEKLTEINKNAFT